MPRVCAGVWWRGVLALACTGVHTAAFCVRAGPFFRIEFNLLRDRVLIEHAIGPGPDVDLNWGYWVNYIGFRFRFIGREKWMYPRALIANPNTRKDLKNNSKVFAHKLDDQYLTVCEEVFRLTHELSVTALEHGRRASLKSLGSVPKRSRTRRAINDHDTDETKGTEQEQQTLE